jgi:hypothetical protein
VIHRAHGRKSRTRLSLASGSGSARGNCRRWRRFPDPHEVQVMVKLSALKTGEVGISWVVVPGLWNGIIGRVTRLWPQPYNSRVSMVSCRSCVYTLIRSGRETFCPLVSPEPPRGAASELCPSISTNHISKRPELVQFRRGAWRYDGCGDGQHAVQHSARRTGISNPEKRCGCQSRQVHEKVPIFSISNLGGRVCAF